MTQTQQPNSEESDIEVVESQAEETTETEVSEQSESQEDDFDPKERVEISDPKVKRKFNDIYKQMKMSDARNRMLADMNQKALDKINELEGRFQQTDHAEAERILTSRLKEARDSGDEDRADKILQEIIDFRVDSKLKGKVETPKPVAPVNDPDVQAVVSYAQETDIRGNLVRPWIADNHPAHKNAMKLAGAFAMEVNAELGYVDIGEVMSRMDDAMKAKPKSPAGNSRAPDPMRANLTNTPPRGKLKLSSQELAVAQKLGVKPEEYAKWKA